MLQTDKETIPVHLGPASYIDKQTPRIETSDTITVIGSRVTVDGKPAIVAAQIKKGNEVLKLPRRQRRSRLVAVRRRGRAVINIRNIAIFTRSIWRANLESRSLPDSMELIMSWRNRRWLWPRREWNLCRPYRRCALCLRRSHARWRIRDAWPCSVSLSQSNISFAVKSIAIGLTLYWPEYFGAEPWVGSKTAYLSPRFALGAKPSPPTRPAHKSLTMSPNMFSATSTE